nr:fasciclin-like arabinogalactan protein 1 [Ipomoea batatas]
MHGIRHRNAQHQEQKCTASETEMQNSRNRDARQWRNSEQPSAMEAYNITAILAKYKEFSTFNHYLSLTHLATDINSRDTITVCVVNDVAMADLLGKHHSIYTVKNIFSLHVLLDYYAAKKLPQLTNGTALTTTMF